VVSKYDWALAVGMGLTSAVAMWYQVRYYKLVDDLLAFLAPIAESEEEEE